MEDPNERPVRSPPAIRWAGPTRRGDRVEPLREQRSRAREEQVTRRSVYREGIRLQERLPLTGTQRADTHIARRAPATSKHGEQVVTSVRQELRITDGRNRPAPGPA